MVLRTTCWTIICYPLKNIYMPAKILRRPKCQVTVMTTVMLECPRPAMYVGNYCFKFSWCLFEIKRKLYHMKWIVVGIVMTNNYCMFIICICSCKIFIIRHSLCLFVNINIVFLLYKMYTLLMPSNMHLKFVVLVVYIRPYVTYPVYDLPYNHFRDIVCMFITNKLTITFAYSWMLGHRPLQRNIVLFRDFVNPIRLHLT